MNRDLISGAAGLGFAAFFSSAMLAQAVLGSLAPHAPDGGPILSIPHEARGEGT
jgi:hypothetical protein